VLVPVKIFQFHHMHYESERYRDAANGLLRTKFVDDTSALEIIPRNSISLLNFAVSEIHEFSNDHNMKLNPKKCKEMLNI
jgi:hypothetical protein